MPCLLPGIIDQSANSMVASGRANQLTAIDIANPLIARGIQYSISMRDFVLREKHDHLGERHEIFTATSR